MSSKSSPQPHAYCTALAQASIAFLLGPLTVTCSVSSNCQRLRLHSRTGEDRKTQSSTESLQHALPGPAPRQSCAVLLSSPVATGLMGLVKPWDVAGRHGDCCMHKTRTRPVISCTKRQNNSLIMFYFLFTYWNVNISDILAFVKILLKWISPLHSYFFLR